MTFSEFNRNRSFVRGNLSKLGTNNCGGFGEGGGEGGEEAEGEEGGRQRSAWVLKQMEVRRSFSSSERGGGREEVGEKW